jgi:steroid 5-alpha reductase family enzyme
MDLFEIHIIALLSCLLAMTLFWNFSGRGDNPAWVDFAWAACIALCVVIYAYFIGLTNYRSILITAFPLLWAVRIMTHLYKDRLAGHHKDGRYIELKASWGAKYRKNFLIFFLMQGVLSYLLSIQFSFGMLYQKELNTLILFLAIALYFTAIIGEAIADRQLYNFKLSDPNKKSVCNVGLWRYSRHPNYFFEWLHWVVYILLLIDTKIVWLPILIALIMLLLVLKITGIPPTEEQSLRSRGDVYRKYQSETSAFFPWFPKVNK